MKKVSIVILNWNGEELLKQFLPSVIQYSPSDIAEVVVADNGSTDHSIETLQTTFPSVKVICLDKNYGFAEGYNLALQQIDTEYTVLLNSDVEVTENWLNAPLDILEKEKEVAAVQPKICSYRDKSKFEYAGAAGGFMDRYGYPYCRGRLFNRVETDKGQYDTAIDILWASGACLFIRTALYKEVGGLDKKFFAHQEEIDLCWRLRSRGYRIVCIPESVVYHVGGATLNEENPRKTFLNFRNNLLTLYKNLPNEELGYVMHVRFWLDYISAVRFLLKGQWKNAKAIYDARVAFQKMKYSYIPVRRENISQTTTPIISELTEDSIVVSFFIKGKKKYSEL